PRQRRYRCRCCLPWRWRRELFQDCRVRCYSCYARVWNFLVSVLLFAAGSIFQRVQRPLREFEHRRRQHLPAPPSAAIIALVRVLIAQRERRRSIRSTSSGSSGGSSSSGGGGDGSSGHTFEEQDSVRRRHSWDPRATETVDRGPISRRGEAQAAGAASGADSRVFGGGRGLRGG
ncbi:unnamed protein product, partial [Scytosiphon promiscuus]